MNTSIPKHQIVLLGVGHTNAHVLKMWRMTPFSDTELVCVSDYPVATYSGMLPGVLAGQYPPERMTIDLVRLCAANGARLIVDKVVGLDSENRALLFEYRPPLPFDALSIGIGSMPSTNGVTIAPNASLAIKPMQTFLRRLIARLNEWKNKTRDVDAADSRPLRIAVVGGGAGGVEIALGLPQRVAMELPGQSIEMHLFHGGERLVPGLLDGTAEHVMRGLRDRSVHVRVGRRVTHVREDGVTLDNGESVGMDLVLWATGAVAPPLLSQLGLPTDERGFLRTDAQLQVQGASGIFAVGDSGTMDGIRRPKSGVFAVRQGPILWKNLGKTLRNEPLVAYRPQVDFLKLLNSGDGRAIGEYKGFSFTSRWAWKWKDYIDVRFMEKYQNYQPMDMEGSHDSGGQPEMRCLGCGGKVSGSVLSRVLSKLDLPHRDEVLIGLDAPDDAALLRLEADRPIAVTTDFFAAPLNDHYLVGRIAALNALSDAWAMRAKPVAALTIATVPFGSERRQESLMTELMAGALHEFRIANTALVGGHTVEGPRVTIGFTVVAEQLEETTWQKTGLEVGDQLILTKPLGSGVLLAAHMQAACESEWFRSLLDTLLMSNEIAASIAAKHPVRAVTDVTGFGLAGHLLEMLDASNVSASLSLAAVPRLPGALELARRGVSSSLAPANRSLSNRIQVADEKSVDAGFELLFDPQTNGGLLLSVAKGSASELLTELQNSCPDAAVIGEVRQCDDTPVVQLQS